MGFEKNKLTIEGFSKKCLNIYDHVSLILINMIVISTVWNDD